MASPCAHEQREAAHPACGTPPSSPWEVLLEQPSLMIGSERAKLSPMLRCQQAVKNNELEQVTAHVGRHGVDMRGKNGFQALHFAACYCKAEIASFLLHPLGADVNAQTARGNTPLHIACFENFVLIIQLLIQHGADPSILNWQQKSPVDMAPRAFSLQAVTRAVCARSGGLLVDPTGKLWRHYYHYFGLRLGADEEELGPAFKQALRRIFLKRDVSDEERHVDLQEACEAYLVLRSSRNRKTFAQGPSPDPIHIEFIDKEYLDVFIKQQMCEAIKTLSPQGAYPLTDDASALRTQGAGVVNGGPESPLPDVSALTAGPSPSQFMSPSSFLAASKAGGETKNTEEIVIESSPLVKFSSPVHRLSDKPGTLVLDSITSRSASPLCGFRGMSSAEAQEHSASPISVTSFSLSQWKTATPRGRNLNNICIRDSDIFIETCSDDLITALEAAIPSCLSPSYTMMSSSETPSKPNNEQIQPQPFLVPASSVGHSPAPHRPPRMPSSREKQPRHESFPEGRPQLPSPQPLEFPQRQLQEKRSSQVDTADHEIETAVFGAEQQQKASVAEGQERAADLCGESSLRAACSICVESEHPEHQYVSFSRRPEADEYLADLSNASLASTATCSGMSSNCSQVTDAQPQAEQSVTSARSSQVVNGEWEQQLQKTLDGGSHSAVLALLRALLDKKNAEIAMLTTALSSARASTDSLQRDLRSEESKVANLRLAIHVRDSLLRRHSLESSVHQARLSEHAATLAEQNESLRRLHHEDAVKIQLEQDEMLQTIQDSMRREAALEGRRAAEQREKDLLLAQANKRLQIQEQRVRDYQHMLDVALTDKSRLERRLACEGGKAADGPGAGESCGISRQMAHVAGLPVSCNFTHYLPSQIVLQASPHAGLGPVEGTRTSHRYVKQSSPRECESPLQMLFMHNQMLCDEILRLRQELAAHPCNPAPAGAYALQRPETKSGTSGASLHFPTVTSEGADLDGGSCKSCSPGEAAETSAWHFHLASQHQTCNSSHHSNSPAFLPEGVPPSSSPHHLVLAGPSVQAPAAQRGLLRSEKDGTPQPFAYFSPPHSAASSAGGDPLNLQPEQTSQLHGEEGGSNKHMVSLQWMGAMDGAGLQQAAQATVLFASPPPQLHREYESLSDWV